MPPTSARGAGEESANVRRGTLPLLYMVWTGAPTLRDLGGHQIFWQACDPGRVADRGSQGSSEWWNTILIPTTTNPAPTKSAPASTRCTQFSCRVRATRHP